MRYSTRASPSMSPLTDCVTVARVTLVPPQPSSHGFSSHEVTLNIPVAFVVILLSLNCWRLTHSSTLFLENQIIPNSPIRPILTNFVSHLKGAVGLALKGEPLLIYRLADYGSWLCRDCIALQKNDFPIAPPFA